MSKIWIRLYQIFSISFFSFNYIESSHMINYDKKNVCDNNVPCTMVS